MIGAIVKLVMLPLELVWLVLRTVKLLLAIAGIAVAIIAFLFLAEQGQALADGPAGLEAGTGGLHSAVTRLEPGDSTMLTLRATNRRGNPAASAQVTLTLPPGVELTTLGRGPWEGECVPPVCRAVFSLEPGESGEAQAEVKLPQDVATVTLTAEFLWFAGELEVAGRTAQLELKAIGQAPLAEEPATSGSLPPLPPTPEPVPPPNVYLVEEKVGAGRIAAVTVITVLAAIALLGVGKFARPRFRLPVPRAIWTVAAKQTGTGSDRLLPEGNHSLPFIIGMLAVILCFWKIGIPAGNIFNSWMPVFAFPLAAIMSVNANRRSKTLYTVLSLLAAILCLTYLASEGEDSDKWLSVAFAVPALLAAGCNWAWNAVMQRIREAPADGGTPRPRGYVPDISNITGQRR